VRLGDARGEAITLAELATVCGDLGRLEEAVSQYRRCADLFVTIGDTKLEGAVRNNLANTLGELHRWDEARHEIQLAIQCQAPFSHAAEPWTSWAILADIEGAAGNAEQAAQAKARARECYLAYRHDGGENHYTDGHIALAVAKLLLAGDVPGATASLDQLLASGTLRDLFTRFVTALKAVVAGSRDRSLADAPDLHYTMAAELLLLIETLEAAAAGAA
jgi:hypothetical protein